MWATCTITASQAGNANFAAAAPVERTFSITPATPVIAFANPGNKVFGSGTFSVSASSPSAVPVTFTASPAGVCTISGNTVTLVGVGACTVTANQVAGGNYAAAAPAPQTFNVTPASNAITFGPLPDQVFGTTPPALAATASSGLTVAFAAQTSAVCTVSGTDVTLVAPGACTVRASQPGNANHAAAAPVDRTFQVLPAIITFPQLPNIPAGSTPPRLMATTNTGLPITYTTLTPAVCSVSGTTITVLAAGTCRIRASLPGLGVTAEQSFEISPIATTVAVATSGSPSLVGQPVTFTASLSPSVTGGTITFRDGTTVLATVPVTGSAASFQTSSLTSGSHTITATYSGATVYGGATSVSLIQAVTPNGTVSLRVVTNGGDGSFAFTSSALSLSASVMTSGGAGQIAATSLNPGIYTVSIKPPSGFGLTAITCSDDDSVGNASAGTATIKLAGGEAVTCTFASANSHKKTVAAIQSFVSRRNDLLLSNDPDGARQIDRLREFNASSGEGGSPTPAAGLSANPMMTDRAVGPLSSFRPSAKPSVLDRQIGPLHSLNDGADQLSGGAGLPFNFLAQTEDVQSLSFSMSLSKAMKFADDQENRRVREAGAQAGLSSTPGAGLPHRPSRFDVWAEGRVGNFSDGRTSVDADGFFRIFHLGADYVVHPSFLIGAHVQYDSMRMRSLSQATDIVGDGWMVGPYATVKLSDNIFFQGRAAWGRSSNAIQPYLTYEDKFDSERWLVRGTLQGHWANGPWTFSPSATLGYIEDTTQAYTDSLGVGIPSIKSTLGQLKFGPEIARRQVFADGSSIEPRAKLEAIWNFAHSASGALPGEDAAAPDDWRGRVELGLKMQSTGGIVLDLSSGYDGLGSDNYHAVTGKVTARVPLN